MLSEDKIPSSFNLSVRGRAGTARACVELHGYRWTHPQRQTYMDGRHCVDMVLSRRRIRAKGRFLGSQSRSRDIGHVIFLPCHVPVEIEWQAGVQESVSCAIDHRLLGDAGADEFVIGDLDVRSDFVRSVMARIAQEVLFPDFASNLMIESLCQTMLLDFSTSSRPAAANGGRLSVQHLRRIDEMLDVEGPGPEIADLAAACDLSPRHFGRLFRAATGGSVGCHAATRRIARAKALLTGSRMMIKEIAWHSGFENAAAFSAAFRRATGQSPREYRGANGFVT